MKLRKVSKGVYEAGGKYYTRPTVGGVRTLRQLKARTPSAAIAEANSTSFKSVYPFSDLAETWLSAGCPDGCGRPRPDEYVAEARRHLARPMEYFGKADIHTIGKKTIGSYGKWRSERVERVGCSGARIADLEMSHVGALYKWARQMEITDADPLSERTRIQRSAEISHSTERAPRSGDEVHRLANAMMMNPRSRSTGWLWLFMCLTGCRCGELRTLRLDAKPLGVAKPPGYYTSQEIVVLRGKQTQAAASRNPIGVIPLSDPAKEMLLAWELWHKEEADGSPYWFPGRSRSQPLAVGALTRALARECRRLGIEHISAHGARSFYASTLRQTEPDDRIVAARLGHTNVAMIERIYGSRMAEKDPNYSFLPSSGEPAWSRYIPAERAVRLSIAV
jgi:site-specific recombinase XerD